MWLFGRTAPGHWDGRVDWRKALKSLVQRAAGRGGERRWSVGLSMGDGAGLPDYLPTLGHTSFLTPLSILQRMREHAYVFRRRGEKSEKAQLNSFCFISLFNQLFFSSLMMKFP